MEVGMMMHYSCSQNQHQVSPYNKSHVGNPKRMMMMNKQQPFISRPSEHLFPSNNNDNIHKGLLQTPPNLFLSNSFPPYFPSFPPPLLHAPSLNNGNNNNNNPVPLLARGLSCPPPIKGKHNNNNNRRTREQSLTPKKSKKAAPSNSPKKEDKSKNNVNVVAATKASSADSSGPDTKDLAASKAVVSLSPTPSNVRGSIGKVSVVNMSSRGGSGKYQLQMDVFSGPVVFTPSPPPSSLPLPTFSLRPKLSCNAQAASASAIDAGATDGLRRLLRLQQ